jgi:hypothetical protein
MVMPTVLLLLLLLDEIVIHTSYKELTNAAPIKIQANGSAVKVNTSHACSTTHCITEARAYFLDPTCSVDMHHTPDAQQPGTP